MQDFVALATLDFDSPARQEDSSLINMSSDIPDFASFDDDDTPATETSRTLPEPGAVRIAGLEGGGEGGDTDAGIFASLPIAAGVVESMTTEQDTHEELRQIDNVFQQWGGSEEAPGGKSPRSNPIRIVKNVNAFVRTTLLKQGRGIPKKSKRGRPSSFSMSDSALYLPDDTISANMSSASHENDVETGESMPSEMQDGTIPANMSSIRDKNDVEIVESMPSEIQVDTIPANTSTASDENGVETSESMASEMQDGTIPANMSSTRDRNDAEVMESMPSEMQDDTIPANMSSMSDKNDVETGESMPSEMQDGTIPANMSFASHENDVETGESMPSEMQDGTIPANMSSTSDKNDVETGDSVRSEIQDDTISGNIPSKGDNNDVETGESMPSERQADTIQGNIISSMGDENGVETGDFIPSELQVDAIRANISSASEMYDVVTGESLPSEMQAITITGNKSSMINRNDDAKTGELIPSEMQDATIPATPFSTSFENEAETDHTKPSEMQDDTFQANMSFTSDTNSVETGESLPSEMQDFAALATLDFDSPARQEDSSLINMSSDIPDFASFDDDDTPATETSRTLPEPGAVRIAGLEGGGEGGDTDTGIFTSLPIAASVVESMTTEQDTHEELRQIDNVFQQWGGSEEAPGGKSPRSNPIRIVKNVNAFVRTTLLKQGRGTRIPKKSKTRRPSSFSMSDSALYLPDEYYFGQHVFREL